MIYEIKEFGKYSLHIIVSKKDGFKVGDQVSIQAPKENNLLDPILLDAIYKSLEKKIQAQIDDTIESVKRGY